MSKGYFYLNMNKCVGCHACVVACSIENKDANIAWRNVTPYNEQSYPGIPLFHLSMACNHCEEAPCLENCPALAYSKDPETGAVIHNSDKCIGCQYCTWACPYDAPKYNKVSGLIEKCTFCNHRLIENLKPACANLCPTGALDFKIAEELEPNDEIAGFTKTKIYPRKKIKLQKQEISKAERVENIFSRKHKKSNSKIELKKEWTLATFTLLASIMVAWLTGNVFADIWLEPILFVSVSVFGFLLSSVHLGKKLRAWRAIFNLRKSWLSREIFCYILFLVFSCTYYYLLPIKILAYLGILFGVFALLSIDRVYKVAIHPAKLEIHSAQTLLTFFLLAALFIGNNYALAFIGILKSVLYIQRKIQFWKQKLPIRIVLSAWRLDMILSFPFLFWFFGAPYMFYWLFGSILIGEIIDRGEYYSELDIITPKKQIEKDIYRR